MNEQQRAAWRRIAETAQVIVGSVMVGLGANWAVGWGSFLIACTLLYVLERTEEAIHTHKP